MKNLKMKDIPENDRPYEKCLKAGPETLSDAELLSIIIRTGNREENSLKLAEQILSLNYPQDGILVSFTLPCRNSCRSKELER